MNTSPITLRATISKDRRLIVELPDDIPVGPVELVIRPLRQKAPAASSLAREGIRAQLRAAGLLLEGPFAPPGILPLSDEELEALRRRLPRGARTADAMIDEDRQERIP